MEAKLIHVKSNVIQMEFHSILNKTGNLTIDEKVDYF